MIISYEDNAKTKRELFLSSELKPPRPAKNLSFDLDHPVVVINDIVPSPEDLQTRYNE